MDCCVVLLHYKELYAVELVSMCSAGCPDSGRSNAPLSSAMRERQFQASRPQGVTALGWKQLTYFSITYVLLFNAPFASSERPLASSI